MNLDSFDSDISKKHNVKNSAGEDEMNEVYRRLDRLENRQDKLEQKFTALLEGIRDIARRHGIYERMRADEEARRLEERTVLLAQRRPRNRGGRRGRGRRGGRNRGARHTSNQIVID